MEAHFVLFCAFIGLVYSGTCNEKRDLAMSRGSGDIPTCSADGKFEPLQCRPGYCWCVDTETGNEIAGTGNRVVRGGTRPNCSKTETLCQTKRKQAMQNGIGGYVPKCTETGKFSAVQHGPGGYSFCVDSDTGVEIPDTRVRFRTANCN